MPLDLSKLKRKSPSPFATDDMLEDLEVPNFYTPVDKIDFEAALQRGLDKIAQEPDGGSTERFRKLGEHRAPVRTEPVPEVSMSLQEFVEAATVTRDGPSKPPDVPD